MPSSIGTVHWWNSRLSPPIGFLANFLCLWMILYRTPKEMQKHSRILLQTCAFDIIFLTICTIGIPVIIIVYHNFLKIISTDGIRIEPGLAVSHRWPSFWPVLCPVWHIGRHFTHPNLFDFQYNGNHQCQSAIHLSLFAA